MNTSDQSDHRHIVNNAAFKLLFDAADDGFCITELVRYDGNPAELVFREANASFLLQTGLTDVTDKTVRETMPAFEPVWLGDWKEMANTGKTSEHEVFIQGAKRWFKVTHIPFAEEGGHFVASKFLDITDKKNQGNGINSRHEMVNAFLVNFSDAVHLYSDPAQIAETACRLLVEELGVERAFWTNVDWPAQQYVVSASHHSEQANVINTRFPMADWEPFTSYFLAGEPAIVNDIQQDPRIVPQKVENYLFASAGANMAIPLMVNGQLKAILAVDQLSPRLWTAEEVLLIRGVAARCWAEVERAETALEMRQSEEKYRSIVECMDEALALCKAVRDADGHLIDYIWLEVNAAQEQLTGLARKQLIGNLRSQTLSPTDAALMGLFENVLETGKPLHTEIYSSAKGGWINLRAFSLGDDRFLTLIYDITERKNAEIALRKSEERLRLAIGTACTVVWEWDVQQNNIQTTPNFADVYGLSAISFAEQGWELLHPDDRDVHFEKVKHAATTGGGYFSQFRIIRPDNNTTIWLEERADSILDDEGKVIKLVGASIDITPAKKIQEDLWQSKENYRTLFESMDEGYCMIKMLYDDNGKFNDWLYLKVNPAFEKHNGLKNATGKRMRELVPDIEEKWMKIYGGVAETGESIRFEEGSTAMQKVFDLYAFRIGNPEERTVAVLFSNITRRKQAEQIQRQTEVWLKGQYQAFQAALSGGSLRESLDPLIETIIEHTSGEARAAFYNIPKHSEGLHLVAGMNEEYAHDINGFKVGADSFACGLAMHTGEVVLTRDVEEAPLWAPFLHVARKHRFRACWSFPVSTKDRPVLGTLAMYFEEPRIPNERELEMASLVAHAAAIIMSRDAELTERAEVENTLRETESRTRKIIETGAVSVMFFNREGVLIDANQVFITTSGWTKSDITSGSINWKTMTPPEWLEPCERLVAQLWETGHIPAAEKEYIFKEGNRSWMLFAARDLGDGTVVEFAIEINDRKHAEAALREAELQYRTNLETEVRQRTIELQNSKSLLQATLDSNLEMIQVFRAVRNAEGKIIDFVWILNNHASEQVYGEVIGKSLLENNPGVVQQGIFDKFIEVMATGIPQQYERHYIHEQFEGWFHQSVVKLDDGVATNTINITERKKAEQERFKNYLLLQKSEDIALLGSWDYHILSGKFKWSDGMYRLFGVKRGTKITPNIYFKYATASGKAAARRVVNLLNTGSADFEETLEIAVSGQVKNINLKATVIKDDNGLPVRVLGVDMDVTAMRLAEDKIRRMEADQQRQIFEVSLSTLEEERHRISESLHNGIGQMLYGIKISLSGMKHSITSQEFSDTKNYTDKLLSDAIVETRRISHELMPATLEEFGIKSAIQDICEQLSDGVKFTCRFTGLTGKLEKYLELAIYRTVQELMTNVIKHAEASLSAVNVDINKEGIRIIVSDNGQGMEASKKQKPGIGLASLRSKIKLLNGDVNIESSNTRGTAIKVFIPLQL